MRYLAIDASLNGTGIRDCYEGGYIPLKDLGLNPKTIEQINEWLSKYENEHYNGFTDEELINNLDKEGREIALMVKNELADVKVVYFSDARMTREII